MTALPNKHYTGQRKAHRENSYGLISLITALLVFGDSNLGKVRQIKHYKY